MNIEEFKDEISDGTVDNIKNTRQNRFTHILLLREVTGPARFTTDGETANTTDIRIGDPEDTTIPVKAVDLFYRKQPGAERRIGKSIQRGLFDDYADDNMAPNDMDQNSPESVLFGSAAGDEGISQRSRVYYNTAYSLRNADTVLEQNIQNAPGDESRNQSKEEQGTWTPDFVTPGTLMPSVVTLDSATAEEVLFTLAVISRTNRYGAGETRGGNVKNHFLGVYHGTSDSPSNLEINRLAVAEMAEKSEKREKQLEKEFEEQESLDLQEAKQAAQEKALEEALEEFVGEKSLDPQEAKQAVTEAYETLLKRAGLELEKVSKEEVQEVVKTLRNEDKLKEVMEDQDDKVSTYLKEEV